MFGANAPGNVDPGALAPSSASLKVTSLIHRPTIHSGDCVLIPHGVVVVVHVIRLEHFRYCVANNIILCSDDAQVRDCWRICAILSPKNSKNMVLYKRSQKTHLAVYAA